MGAMDVPQVNDALPIETARHDRSVDQHRRLAAERMAEADSVILGRLQTRPRKLIVLVDVYIVGNLDPASRLDLLLDPVVETELPLQDFQRCPVTVPLQIRQVVL